MDDEAKPYLLTEASGLTGLSVDALRKRIERKRLRGSRSNEDGQWRVWLTSKDVETAKAGRSLDKSGQDADSPADEARTIKALEDELATVREERDRNRDRAAKAEGEAVVLREWAEAAEGRLQAAGRRLDEERERTETETAKLREETAGLAVRVAVAETEAKGLREALAEARRPFWRRWTG